MISRPPGSAARRPSLAGLPPLWASRYVAGDSAPASVKYARHSPAGWDPYGGLDVKVLQFSMVAEEVRTRARRRPGRRRHHRARPHRNPEGELRVSEPDDIDRSVQSEHSLSLETGPNSHTACYGLFTRSVV